LCLVRLSSRISFPNRYECTTNFRDVKPTVQILSNNKRNAEVQGARKSAPIAGFRGFADSARSLSMAGFSEIDCRGCAKSCTSATSNHRLEFATFRGQAHGKNRLHREHRCARFGGMLAEIVCPRILSLSSQPVVPGGHRRCNVRSWRQRHPARYNVREGS